MTGIATDVAVTAFLMSGQSRQIFITPRHLTERTLLDDTNGSLRFAKSDSFPKLIAECKDNTQANKHK